MNEIMKNSISTTKLIFAKVSSFILIFSFLNFSEASQKVSQLELIINKSAALNSEGLSELFYVEIPKAKNNYYPLSLAVSFEGDPGHYYYAEEITGPSGQVTGPNTSLSNISDFIFNYLSGYPISQVQSINPAGPGEVQGFGAFLVPSNPKVKLEPGIWSFKIRGGIYAANAEGKRIFQNLPSKVKIKGYLKSTVVPFEKVKSGSVNINIYFTAKSSWNSNNIVNDTLKKNEFNNFINSAKEPYAKGDGNRNVELNIGSVNDLKDSTLPLLDQIRNLGTNDGINVFFTGNAGSIGGRSLGIPGTFFNDIFGNGVVLGNNMVGRVLAHELGHFFGLWHTEGLLPDMLEDTSEYGGMLMATTNPQSDITKMQMDVILFNPWVTLHD